MRLESAFNSSRQGIDAHGKAIAVVGDNISNSNTVGFKDSRVEFTDLISSGRESSEPFEMPKTGSGVAIERVRQIHQTGVIEFSGRQLDAAIAGNGFFMTGSATSPVLSRAGNFEVSPEGILVNNTGEAVLGFSGATGTTLGPIDMLNIDLTGDPTTAATLTGNLSSSAEVATLPVNPESFTDLGRGSSFTNTVGMFDSLGAEHPVKLYYFKTAPNSWTVQAYVDGAEVGGTAGQPTMIGSQVLPFGQNGQIPEGTAATLNMQAAWSGGAEASTIALDLSGMTQFATGSQVSNLTRDGKASGSISGYAFDSDGSLYAQLSTGNQVKIGTLQLANVQNVDGLERAGSASYVETDKSGARVTGSPGAQGMGSIEAASLEQSTVDIASEFVELVLYQRGYQANSQVLNTTSDMIRDTIGLLR